MASFDYDVIVIGSGLGGLTTASLLAQLGNRRVLVLERHFKLGGFTHSFRRGKYQWDPGVHYVGSMQRGSLARQLMDLVTRRGVDWHKIASPFEEYVFPTERFSVPDDPQLYLAQLCDRFPHEARRLKQYFRDLNAARNWMARWFIGKVYGDWALNLMLVWGRRLPTMLTADYMARFSDPLLRAILTAQWPDYGTPPQASAFGFHAIVAGDYLEGAYYPLGGAQQIAQHAMAAIVDHGGECRVSHPASRIMVRQGRACGVMVDHRGASTEVTAPVIVSNAGAVRTFLDLVPPGFAERERERAKRLRPGTSAEVAFLGLHTDPQTRGFADRNYWLYANTEHRAGANATASSMINEHEAHRIDCVFVSFGSLRNPQQATHTAQLVTFTAGSPWEEYGRLPWRQRGQHYEEHKERRLSEMLDFVEARLPGLRELIRYQELATPLTFRTFAGYRGGQIYGQPCDPARLGRDRWMIATSLPGLYLTGSDPGSPGVNGALVAGAMTAARILGPLGLPKVMGAARQQN